MLDIITWNNDVSFPAHRYNKNIITMNKKFAHMLSVALSDSFLIAHKCILANVFFDSGFRYFQIGNPKP